MPLASDASLVEAARAGERTAQEALFRRYARMVNAMAFRLVGPEVEEVEDLVQDSFVAALSSLDRLGEPARFSTWLGSIVVRTAHKRLRRRRLRSRVGPTGMEPGDLDRMIATTAPPDVVAEVRLIYALVERLPTEERLALLLRRVQGMTLPEVAEAMGLSLATVKRRLAAAETALEGARRRGE
ncbi:MAG TPA: sigma-70 family RNA polymerase sigma factor [Sandaracinaceae bacterium LLY-WYZ-13_1]|nr:sigma-70 family RNA polymerase sigma factor [Sandaracinaceae bacterium LLY-WYZ-13_1]